MGGDGVLAMMQRFFKVLILPTYLFFVSKKEGCILRQAHPRNKLALLLKHVNIFKK